MEIKLSSRVSVPESVLFRELGEESVLLNLDSERYFGLDDVGTRMFAVMSNAPSLRAACETLSAEYDAPLETIQHDLTELVDKLVARGLLALEDC